VRTKILCIALTSAVSAAAQHTPLTGQYLFNGLLINPAYAGSRDAMAINLTYRQQWVGFSGAPTTQILSAHSPIKSTRMSAGLLLLNDRIGVSRETSALANFAYRLPLRHGKLQFGLGGGVSFLQADWSSLAVQDRNDAQFATNTRGSVQPNFSAGVYYYKKTYFIGASVPFVMTRRYDADRERWTLRNDKAQYQPMITAGYIITLSKQLKLKPSTLVRYTVASGFQADLSSNLIINDRIWAGVSYRSGDAFIGSFEVLPTQQLRLGYAYELGLSAINPYHQGTHELMLQYEFGKRLNVRDPRYF
jgi:type IX secretion system PorP/SprF family membrane protein